MSRYGQRSESRNRRSRSRERYDRPYPTGSREFGDRRTSRSPPRERQRFNSSESSTYRRGEDFSRDRERHQRNDFRVEQQSGGERVSSNFRENSGHGGRGEGGFGGRQSGGGRGGKNPQMGDMVSVVNQVARYNSLINDTACLRIMDPPIDARNRQEIIAGESAKKYILPEIDPWRVADCIGVPVNNVLANFFVVDPRFLPTMIFHYNIMIFSKRDHLQIMQKDPASTASAEPKDLCKELDNQLNTKIIGTFFAMHADALRTSSGGKIGISYDGKSSLYTSQYLVLPLDATKSFLADVQLKGVPFVVIIKEVEVLDIPRTHDQWRDLGVKNLSVLQSLNVALLTFARWQLAEENPQWLLSGTKVFQVSGQTFDFGGMYLGRIGYSTGLRPCVSGLSMVVEVSVSCFLKGGSLLEIMALIGNFRSVDSMIREGCCSNFSHPFVRKVLGLLKNTKIKTKHLGQTKKLKEFSYAADDRASCFELDREGSSSQSLTVAAYYKQKVATDPRYSAHLPRHGLRYPSAVTVNIGSKKKAVLVPIELVLLVEGQIRNNLPNEVASSVIKEAAIPPARRFHILTQESQRQGLFHALKGDENITTFGLQNVSTTPVMVHAVILPPPKLQYSNRIIQPELKGAWNLVGNVQFAYPAPIDSSDQRISYGLVITYLRGRPNRIEDAMYRFRDSLEREAEAVGTPLHLIDGRIEVISGDDESLASVMQHCKKLGARIVVVLLYTDVYAFVKLAADRVALPTQCVKWSNVERPPNRYHTSLLIKMNYKMGGINHTLASRVPQGMRIPKSEPVFQDPPQSISWLFDEPCMVMGVDVSHPDFGKSGNSVVAVVASMDGKLGQYAAYVTTCTSREEPVCNLQEATSSLLDTFSRRNGGVSPRKIIVYRDGVSESQFDKVLERELAAYKEALMLHGFGPDDVQISIIVCQKRHQTRLVYQADPSIDGTGDYVNPCVGLCVDGRSFVGENKKRKDVDKDCINTAGWNEFYLNSHAAVLGTSKPCKYILIYDEIGLKLSEIELFTFWITHLYCRCTKSVSYATPAYYAHWAAARGKTLLSAGASEQELSALSQAWLNESLPSMYFV